ncbi:class I adenylate-forming enzyme family protein [Streptomyces sp. TP-A0874]|uniref:class I adenylate-forming enzyme family protein n=1 Tax=Streptomyces sp. TP-A0874 TaxID=549819 RepID=UPI00085334D1|nr:class I adenylate-forming enzyme family protein [Streptomyces sp. TP-A0874]
MSSKDGPLSLGSLFDVHAERGCRTRFHLSRPFDIAPGGGTEYDSAELAALVERASGWLYATGARAGDRIAIAKDNHWDYLVLACAAARFGALPVLVSGALPPETLRTVLDRAAARVLVTTAAVLDRAAEAGADLKGAAERTVCLDEPAPGAVFAPELGGGPVPAPVRTASYEPMVATHTSGTTGAPKLVVHSADTIMGHLGRTESLPWPIVGMKPWDTVATATPYNHMRMITWSAGTLRLAPRRALVLHGPDRESAVRMFRRHRPTYLEAVPATYGAWEELAGDSEGLFAKVRLYVSTFDAMHPPTVRRFLAASKRPFAGWLQGWGQSETGPMTFRLLTRRALAARGERHPTTRDVGRPIPGFTGMRVVDPKTMQRVPAGTPGLVLARTNGRCIGYLGEEDRWQGKALGRWWNTGDWAVRTRTGAFRLLDREVDRVPGMSCIEVEDVLADRLPDLLEAVVLAVRGGRPLPVVCTRDGALPPEEWRRATEDLPDMDEPVLMPWEALPRTSTGKVRRLELRERLLAGAGTFGTGRWT